MNIAIFSPYAEPEKGACTIRVNYFIEAFEKLGYSVKVFAPERENIKSTKKIIRYKGIKGLIKNAFSEKFDLFFGVSPPLTPNFFILLIAKIKGIPFILDAKDDAIALLPCKKNLTKKIKHLIYMFLRKIVYRKADMLLFLTKEDLELESKRYNLKKEKIFLAPNGSDTEKIFSLKEKTSLRKKFGLSEEDLILIYAGTIGDEPIENIFNSITKEFIEKNSIKFLLVLNYENSKQEKEKLEKINEIIEKKELKEKTKIFLNVPFEKMSEFFSIADIALLPWNSILKTSLPVKIFDYLAAELPIIAVSEKKTAIAEFFEENNFAGINIENFNELEKAIIECKNSENKEKKDKRRNLIKEKFERKKIMEEIIKEIKAKFLQ